MSETRQRQIQEGAERMRTFVSEVFGESAESVEMLKEAEHGLILKLSGSDLTTLRDPKAHRRNGMTFHGILDNVGGFAEAIAADYPDAGPLEIVVACRNMMATDLQRAERTPIAGADFGTGNAQNDMSL